MSQRKLIDNLLKHLGLTEVEAKKLQEKLKYKNLLDYLVSECRKKDRRTFHKLFDKAEREINLDFLTFEEVWSFLEKLEQIVSSFKMH